MFGPREIVIPPRHALTGSLSGHHEFPSIKLPLPILHGTDDKATVCKGSQFLYDTAGSQDKTLKLYEGHYHDPLNDFGKEQVMADIQGWMGARLQGT